MSGEQSRFSRLDAWWRTQNPLGRHVWPGLFTMRVASNGDPWPSAEIPAQIAAIRASRDGTTESVGEIHFRLSGMAPASALGQRLIGETYATPAIVPASPWLGAQAPAAPLVDACTDAADSTARIAADSAAAVPPTIVPPIRVTKDAPPPIRVTKDGPVPNGPRGAMAPTPRTIVAGATLPVTEPGDVPARWWVVQLRAADGAWSTLTLPGDLAALPVTLANGARAAFVSVTAISPTGVASAPTVVKVE